jgi:type IV secretion system protein VirB1
LAVTAAAYASTAAKPAGSQPAVETAESRPAIPVPGPGALMPEPQRAAAGMLSQIPTQVVGVNGDPYQTRIVQPAPTTGLPANQLPLPSPDAMSGSQAAKTRKAQESSATKTVTALRGGSLVHATESSGRPENTANGAQPGAASTQHDENSGKPDNSFVF